MRINWIDQLKGFAIFMVVYSHNFPFINDYIYSFNMPLFFIVSGFFHPKEQTIKSIKKRAKSILIPYFLWATILYVFWFLIGRKMGVSKTANLSPMDNFKGVFFAQGDMAYMDWGIPMWFLPAVFSTFLVFYLIRLLSKSKSFQVFITLLIGVIGLTISYYFKYHYFWSCDVAMVAVVFYAFGFFSRVYLIDTKRGNSWWFILLIGVIHILLSTQNIKVDMYRSIYGNPLLFYLNGIIGSLFFILFFKKIPVSRFLSFLGKITIPILALQLRAMSAIKLILYLILGMTIFEFTELQKFYLAIIQVLLIIPIGWLINKYFPVLNGSYKKV